MAIKVIVRWQTKNQQDIAAIRKYFNIPRYTTLNGWSPAEIEEKDMPMLEETSRRNFIRFRRVEWVFNGSSYSWGEWC